MGGRHRHILREGFNFGPAGLFVLSSASELVLDGCEQFYAALLHQRCISPRSKLLAAYCDNYAGMPEVHIGGGVYFVVWQYMDASSQHRHAAHFWWRFRVFAMPCTTFAIRRQVEEKGLTWC